ncbi:MAG: glycosyltransferase family 4 protein [Oscillospiraceae bacterium]|nr:glycosyltransferase family 4 protein [Oscillospiraceae bacterium]
MKNKEKIIVLNKFIPAPAYNGGAKRNLAWIKFLSKRYDIILIGFWDKKYKGEMISFLEKYNVKVYGCSFSRSMISLMINFLGSIFSKMPVTCKQYYNSIIEDTISKAIEDYDIKFVFCSELAMMQYCNNMQIPIYFDDHNIEHILLERSSKFSKFPINLFLKRESKLMKAFEYHAFEISKEITCVSNTDRMLIPDEYKNKVVVVNNTYDNNNTKQGNLFEKPTIVFVGSISWKPNKQGLKHFIKNIFPLILKKNNEVMLKIIGSNIDNYIKSYSNDNINFYENLDEEEKSNIISQSWICIVPVYFGSGTRIKIIEYWSHSKPVISTSIGAEGLILSDGTKIVDSDISFSEEICNLINDKEKIEEMGLENNKLFNLHYSEEAVYENSLYNTLFA